MEKLKLTKLDLASKLITESYKADKPDSGYVSCVVEPSDTWTHYWFNEARKSKKNRYHIEDITEVSSALPSYSFGVSLSKNGGKPHFEDRTGLFKLMFSDGSFIYFAKWFEGTGRTRKVVTMAGTENDVWYRFLKMFKQERAKLTKPKVGVFKAELQPALMGHELVYERYKNIPNNLIFHTELQRIKDSVNYYFNHVPDFMKFNQAGRRTILLYGEPGTSKTSTLYQLALEHKVSKSVVFTTDIASLASHIKRCEKHNVPTLAFLEDCESALRFNDTNVKSFLSGINAGRNKGGTCIVFTSNYPQVIEATIRERPERIDELHYIGPISGELLIKCAEFYFGKFSPGEAVISEVLTKPMAGAEVKLFVENTLRYCASRQKELNKAAMMAVLKNYRSDVKKLLKYASSQTPKTYTQATEEPERMGFRRPREEDDLFEVENPF